MLFQLVQIELNADGQIVATTRTQPLFELPQDAMAMAEFSASRCGDDYGFDADDDCWWARREDGHRLAFVVRPIIVPGLHAAA